MGIVLVAKRRGVTVLDGVWNDFRNQAGFDLEATQGMKMGFDGKTLIHPSQVDNANRVFSPSPEAVDEALRIVALFSDPQHAASNVVNLTAAWSKDSTTSNLCDCSQPMRALRQNALNLPRAGAW